MQIYIYIQTHILLYIHTHIYVLYISYICVYVCVYIHICTHIVSVSLETLTNTDMKFIFKSLWKIERICSYLDMNYGHTQYQDTLLVSESLKRHLTPLLESSSVFTTHCFLGFSVFPVLHGPHQQCFGHDGVKVCCRRAVLQKLPEMIASVGLSLHFPASGARENKVHVILSCFVHGCLDSLTPRCTLPDFKVCSTCAELFLNETVKIIISFHALPKLMRSA